jgi:hypothetical protein
VKLLLVAAVLLVVHLVGGGRSGLDSQIAPIVGPHVFSLGGWELRTITREVLPSLWRRAPAGDVTAVRAYFADVQQARTLQSAVEPDRGAMSADVAGGQAELARLRELQQSLAPTVQRVIERQIADTLRGQGIWSPFNLRISVPPVSFKLARPPNLLVVSPRDRIESVSETMLNPDLSGEEAAAIEARVDQLNVSSLVTGIGGLGATYPTFVSDDMDLLATIQTSAHEWVHQYLAFRPLGFRYVLDLIGIRPSRDITSMNETLADIVGREIGNLVYQEYYGGSPAGEAAGEPAAEATFDFNREMRETRQQVDAYLAQGQVDAAEQYMRERRDFLDSHGYHIRKLNQAYFAFYGSYTDSPTSVDPIGADLRQLRSQSGSLQRFLVRASSITNRQSLKDAVASGR